MITELMDHCNNHFIRTVEAPELTFAAAASVYTISGDFGEEYLVGQYVYICGSLLNNGAYLITNVATGVLTVSTLVTAETTDDAYIFGCAVPRSFLALDTEITAWVAASQHIGVASEKIDDYSIAYGADAQQGWARVYKARLNQFRAMYDDIERCVRYGY